MDSLKVAILQTTSVDDLKTNLNKFLEVFEALPSGVRLVCLPENSLYMRCREGAQVEAIDIDHGALSAIAKVCAEKRFYVHLGAIPLLHEGRVFNSSVLISDKGEISASYQKIHLFDITLEGQAPFRESDVFQHGSEPKIFSIDGWNFGQSICYDIRFSELYSVYAKAGVDVILIPAAFLVKTGQAHWEILLRARAIESQAYVIASAQTGTHNGIHGGQKMTYGHSLVVSPWGDVIKDLGTEVGFAILELKKSEIQKVRTQIPMRNHRRI